MKFRFLVFILLAVNLFALTPQEKKGLVFMYQEEKLAKDVYATLGKMYPNVRVFNIYRAEVMHESCVANVMRHYGITFPVRGNRTGVFADKKLQILYNRLIEKGKKSLTDALEVGIMVEVTDIEDLDKYLNSATSSDVIALFEFLRAGSYNHYNGFDRTLQYYTGKSACGIMDKRWCKNYPFQRGVGRKYMNYYWFGGRGGMMMK
jgi:hypothetical protein